MLDGPSGHEQQRGGGNGYGTLQKDDYGTLGKGDINIIYCNTSAYEVVTSTDKVRLTNDDDWSRTLPVEKYKAGNDQCRNCWKISRNDVGSFPAFVLASPASVIGSQET